MKPRVWDILVQREYDYRPSYMKELLQNLYAPENVSYKPLAVQQSAPNLISLQLHPKQWNALLSHTLSHGLYCGDINGELPFIPSRNFDSVTYTQWYPFDTGLFGRMYEKAKWQLVDTESFDEVFDIRGNFTHFDWNPVDVNHVALVEGNIVKFVDLRVGGALSSLIPKSRHYCNLSRVAYCPTDEHGIFIGNSDGRIFYYDTRILTKSVAKTPTLDRNFRATITSMQFAPQATQLITVSNEIIQWNLKLKQSKDNIIQNSNIRFEAKLANIDPLFSLGNLMQPFITDRWIYLGSKNFINWTNDITAFDRKTGRIGQELYSNIQFLSNLEDYTNYITGVRRTKYEDDPNPQLVFIKNNCGLIRCTLLDIDTPARLASSVDPVFDQQMDDRWSDDEM